MNEDSAVKITVRVRPLKESEDRINNILEIYQDNIVVIKGQPFCFDYVLTPEVSQAKLYEQTIEPLVSKLESGINCTALVVGQTGTGKSYTMGLHVEFLDIHSDRQGIIPRCLQDILAKATPDTELQVSFVEIYNEKVYDLLSDNPAEAIMSRGSKYNGGQKKILRNVKQCQTILKQGTRNRHIRATSMNSQSSRSHAIVSLHFKTKRNNDVIESCFNFVDLAGTEGVRRTGHQGAALSEGVNINQGLLCVSKILKAMSDGQKVIPYRDSVIGTVLQESLSPNSYLTLLACVSPQEIDMSETLSTLRFAQQAKQIKRTPTMNAVLAQIAINKRKTALKTPATLKRPLAPINTNAMPQPAQRFNTFCTPNKKKAPEAHSLNRTDLGVVPETYKKAAQIGIIPPSCYQKPVDGSVRDYLLLNRESLFNQTNESVFSNMPFNVSTSTNFDGQSANPMSLSPLVRKCVAVFGDTMEKVMREMLVEKCEQTLIPGATCAETAMSSKPKPLMTSSPVFKRPPVMKNIDTSTSTDISMSSLSPHENSRLRSSHSRRKRSPRMPIYDFGTQNQVPRRQSKRLSLKRVHEIRRRSVRLASQMERVPEPVSDGNGQAAAAKAASNRNKKKNPLENNDIVATYSNNNQNKRTASLKKHRAEILNLLNMGTIKQLQLLPKIGPKTAYQIITQRTLTGKFRTMADVEKLSLWSGSSWERFAQANFLK